MRPPVEADLGPMIGEPIQYIAYRRGHRAPRWIENGTSLVIAWVAVTIFGALLLAFVVMLFAFAAAEANHMHAYSQLIDTVGLPESDYEAFTEFAEMKEKHEYLFADRTENVDGTKRPKIERLALDLAVFSAFGEGMQLFSSFAVLLSFKRRNLMKGMSTIVEWSLRDESHHVESMIKLFHTLIKENPKAWNDELKASIRQTCKEMVTLEDRFIDLMFAMGEIPGITSADTKTYIRYTADRRMIQLGLKPIYRQKENPFEWIDEMMAAHTHTNFFEGRSTEYGKGGVVGWDKQPWSFVDNMAPKVSVTT